MASGTLDHKYGSSTPRTRVERNDEERLNSFRVSGKSPVEPKDKKDLRKGPGGSVSLEKR